VPTDLPRLLLSAAALVTAALHIRAEYRGPRWQVYALKPATTTLVVLVALAAPEPVSATYRVLVVAGLLFSLAGDVLLMLAEDRFLAGLACFLVAHLLYAAAFAGAGAGLVSPALAVPYVLVGAMILRSLWADLGRVRAPVALYVTVIVVMAWQAAARWEQTSHRGALLAAVGAALFVASDAALAVNRFGSSFRSAQLVVLSTYYAAQWLIALSVAR
jgi:uncharacterized membrane protein YhhN